jgi:predicted Na+-dependent transporter
MSKITLIGLFFFPLVVSLLAAKDIFENKELSNNAKLVWIIVAVMIPLLGAIAYFFFGKSKRFN